MSSDPGGERLVRQLRHDVDDVYELLTEHGGRLGEIESRLGRIEAGQQQVLELLRETRGG